MNWFQLDPQSIAAHAKACGEPEDMPTLAESILRGTIGFTIVSVAGFTPWVLAGKWFYRNPGEVAMYSSCALVFMSLSGLLLHRLIIGPGSLQRFYIFFCIAFAAYSAAWIAGWMALKGHWGSLVGLLAGTVAMGLVFAAAFEAWGAALKIIAALFVLNALGYFVGGWIEGYLAQQSEFGFLSGAPLTIFMKYAWAICYGVGLGAGLGFAFHASQANARELIQASS